MPPTGAQWDFHIDNSDVQFIMDHGGSAEWLTERGREVNRRVTAIVFSKMLVALDQVSASGEAKKNISMKRTGKYKYSIIEGDKTPANRIIRKGRRATGKASDAPPISEIVNWLIDKKINIRPPERGGKKFTRWTKKGGRRANLSSQPSRPFKSDMRQVAAVIAKGIASEGMVTLVPKQPSGSARFDYPDYAARLARGPVEKFTLAAGRGIAFAYMEWARTGRTKSFGDWDKFSHPDIESARSSLEL